MTNGKYFQVLNIELDEQKEINDSVIKSSAGLLLCVWE